jgi:hypothetical protein
VSGAGRGTLDGDGGQPGQCLRCGDAPQRGAGRRPARGLCPRCHEWARRHGRLDDYPCLPVRWAPTHAVMTARHEGRVEDFAFLTAELGVPFREACRRLGVTLRTGERYKAILRSREAGSAAA